MKQIKPLEGNREQFESILTMLEKYHKKYSAQISEKKSTSDPLAYSAVVYFLDQFFEGDFKGKTILEIGPEYGFALRALKQMGAEVYAIDKQRHIDHETCGKEGIHYLCGDLTEIPERTIVRPMDLFNKANFTRYDALITRRTLQEPVMRDKDVLKMLSVLRNIAHVQVHEIESWDSHFLEEPGLKHVKDLGYTVLHSEQSFIRLNDIVILEPKQ